MQCPRCHTENREGRRFCCECGLSFASTCPSRGFLNEASTPCADFFTRRAFVGRLTAAGLAGIVGLRPDPAQAEPPPETTRLRVLRTPSICEAPAQVASGLLESEGFTDVQYVRVDNSVAADRVLASG